MPFNTIFVLTLMSSQLYLSGNGQSKFVTCEFDLVDLNQNVLEFLPDECKTADRDPILRPLMVDESKKFQEFLTELGTKENWNEQAEEEGRESLTLNFDLRNTVYDRADGNCTMTSESSNDFVDCVIKNREAMTNAVRGYE